MITATYRLQINHQFQFKNIKKIIPYLYELGISHLYLSPITKAVPGSLHGYDVIDSAHINPELGTSLEFYDLKKCLAENNMGLFIDIVPNHMSTHHENLWWQNVVLKREQSPYCKFFDIYKINAQELKYRRFFDINELVCLNIYDEEVFNKTHELIVKLIQKKIVDGLRVDHIDGLYQPKNYLTKLRHINPKLYIIVEKILATHEMLPDQWPIEGTTGYDFLNQLNSIFINKVGYEVIEKKYRSIIKKNDDKDKERYLNKKKIILLLFKKELEYLTECLIDALPRDEIKKNKSKWCQVIIEITACLPVYRTYMEDKKATSLIDLSYIQFAFNAAKKLNDDKEINEYIDYLLQCIQKEKILKWCEAWQVFSGPVMAKGYEDTTCYTYNAFISLNEVGSDPEQLQNLEDLNYFYQQQLSRFLKWPCSMLTTSTHDTKRSEDIRARLNVLSEFPEEWNRLLEEWIERNSQYKSHGFPEVNMEIFIYQSLLGAWPLEDNEQENFKMRVKEYLIKSAREAKVHTSWFEPNVLYENALTDFLQTILKKENSKFLESFNRFQQKIAFYGFMNALSQLLIKLTQPGIPDCYQGNEIWDFSLVDPDNRRPVDFLAIEAKYAKLQAKIRKLSPLKLRKILQQWKNAEIKLFVIRQVLALRRKYGELFQKGDYIPLEARGSKANHVIAYLRVLKKKHLLIIAPRFFSALYELHHLEDPHWQDTLLIIPKQYQMDYSHLFSGQTFSRDKDSLKLSEVMSTFPLALLSSCKIK